MGLTFHAPFTDPDDPLHLIAGTGSLTFTRASTAKFVHPVTGLLTTAAIDTLRIEANGALVESGSTNRCKQSETMGTTWSASNITVGDNDTVAPDGETTADLLTASAANGTIIQDLGTYPSVAHTFSVYLKRKTGTGNIDLTLDNGATWTTKAITSSWARYSITQAVADPDCGIRIVTSGDEIWAWGAQFELKNFCTSYIPTTTENVERGADALLAQCSGNISGTVGTITLRIYNPIIESNVNATLIQAGGDPVQTGGSAGAIKLVYFDGTNTGNHNTTLYNLTTYRVGIAWQTSVAQAVNGSVESGKTFDGDFTPGVSIGIGATTKGLNAFCGNICDLKIYGHAMSDAELGLETSVWDVGVIDVISRTMSYSRIIGDSVGVSDHLLAEIFGGETHNRYLSDSLGVTDSLAQSFVLFRTIAESLGISDRMAFAHQYARAISDSVGVADFLHRIVQFTRRAVDQVGVTDRVFITRLYARVLADVLNVVDAPSRKVGYGRAISDGVGVSDARARMVAYVRRNADTVGVSDAIVKFTTVVLFRYAVDSVGVTDRHVDTVVGALIRTIAEAIGVSDYRYYEKGMARLLRDAIGITDSARPTRGYGRRVSDTVGVSDSVRRALYAVRVMADDLGVTDFPKRYMSITRKISEDVGVLDDESRAFTFIRTLMEPLGLSDGAFSGILTIRRIAESVGVTDAIAIRILTAGYLAILLELYDHFASVDSLAHRIELTAGAPAITVEVD